MVVVSVNRTCPQVRQGFALIGPFAFRKGHGLPPFVDVFRSMDSRRPTRTSLGSYSNCPENSNVLGPSRTAPYYSSSDSAPFARP